MTDGYDPACGRCGHLYSDHYETDDENDYSMFNYKKVTKKAPVKNA